MDNELLLKKIADCESDDQIKKLSGKLLPEITVDNINFLFDKFARINKPLIDEEKKIYGFYGKLLRQKVSNKQLKKFIFLLFLNQILLIDKSKIILLFKAGNWANKEVFKIMDNLEKMIASHQEILFDFIYLNKVDDKIIDKLKNLDFVHFKAMPGNNKKELAKNKYFTQFFAQLDNYLVSQQINDNLSKNKRKSNKTRKI